MADSFRNSFIYTKITLLINGVRIYPCSDKFWTTVHNFQYYFNICWLYQDVFAEFAWLLDGIHNSKSFKEISYIIPCLAISLLSSSKSIPMLYYNEIVVNIVEKLAKLHPLVDETPLTEEENNKIMEFEYLPEEGKKIDADMSEKIERRIVHDSIWLLNTIIRLWFYSCVSVVVTWSILPLLVMCYEYLKDGQTTFQLPYLTKYFFDSFTTTAWPLVYIHHVWSTVVAGLFVFGCDTFIYSFCMYIHMHFQILNHRYEFLVSDSVTETRQRLKGLVKRHQELIELIDQMDTVCSKSTLINIVMSSVLICFCTFNITIFTDQGAIFAFLTFLVSQIAQISMLCFFADLIMKSSMQVGDAIYRSRWYDLDPATKRSVFLIISRSQKPCRLTAAHFADVNLSSFTTILSRSWSYFALLRTVYK